MDAWSPDGRGKPGTCPYPGFLGKEVEKAGNTQNTKVVSVLN
jgi:hypothetical protein